MKEQALFFNWLVENGCQKTTAKHYTRQVGYLVAYLDGKKFDLMTAEQYKKFLSFKGWRSEMQRNNRSALKNYAIFLGIENHPLLAHEVHKGECVPRDCITSQQMAELREVMNTYPEYMRIRNLAILETFWATFVRRFELANAKLSDLDLENGFLVVWAKAKQRKGRRKQRKVLSPYAREALEAWLEIRKVDDDSIFGLSSAGMSSFFKRLNSRVAFKVSSHPFRHGGATNAANHRNVNARQIIAQGGWEDPKIFLHYTQQCDLTAYAESMWGNDA